MTHQFTFLNTVVTFQWSENHDIFTILQHWGMVICFKCLPLQLHRSKNWLNCCFLLMDGVWPFFSFCFIWGRIVELFSPWPISSHWGVLSKCLAYSKAASDPFVYSLLRHQYRKTCSLLANKVLKRSPLNSSSLRMENNAGRNNSNTTSNIQPATNKPIGQWRSTLSETRCGHLTLRLTLMKTGVWQ